MTHAPGRFPRFALASLALVCAGAVGCHDASAPHQPMPPVDQMANLGTVIVEVDMVHGTVQTHPLGQSVTPPKGVSAEFYGLPGQINYTFGPGPVSPVTLAPSGDKLFILRARIENKLTFSVGTHVAHASAAFPADTMGLFVYLSTPPFLISGIGPCAGCTVTVDSVDGHAHFTDVNQPYWYWRTILEPTDGVAHTGRDFTDQIVGVNAVTGGIDYYRDFVFHTSPAVTNFSFGISASAAWVAGNGTETHWIVSYLADSMPNRIGSGALSSATDLRSEPDWRFLGTAGAVTDTSITGTGCPSGTSCLRITSALRPTAADTGSFFYYRSDSLGGTQDGFITATVSTTAPAAIPTVFLGLQDNVKRAVVAMSGTQAGFIDATGAFLGTPFNPSGMTSFRVAKHGNTDVSVYSPASSTTALTTVLYASLPPANPQVLQYKLFFLFGNHSTNTTASTSLWSNVVYGIGSSGP